MQSKPHRPPEKPGRIETGWRLNRFLARAGIASRRACDLLIEDGAVRVNGRLVTSPGTRVDPGDKVSCMGETVVLPVPRTAVLNKPIGYETTMAAGEKRSISELILKLPFRGGVPVGRLDINTGGLLLVSSDGDLVHRLTHPRWMVDREYRLNLGTECTPELLDRLRRGALIGPGETSRPASVKPSGARGILIVLRTGRNREVRRLAEACGIPLAGLERIRYGTVRLDGLARGAWRMLEGGELLELRRLVGLEPPQRGAKS
jgi:23S rRNA pseudouridine2605 synthase